MINRPFSVQSYSKRREFAAEAEEMKKNIGIFTTNITRKEVKLFLITEEIE